MKNTNNKELIRKLEGIHTIESVMDILSVSKEKAIYCVHLLRKQGYVKTRKLNNNKRVYSISIQNKLGGSSYYDIINKYSPIKVSPPNVHYIYGRDISLEETLVFAIKTDSIRTILAALALFKKISDWTELYHLAKQNRVERQVGALYDLSRKYVKTKRMTKTFRNYALPKEEYSFKYFIQGIRSKDFQDIENKWKVYIPFNKEDLEVYE